MNVAVVDHLRRMGWFATERAGNYWSFDHHNIMFSTLIKEHTHSSWWNHTHWGAQCVPIDCPSWLVNFLWVTKHCSSISHHMHCIPVGSYLGVNFESRLIWDDHMIRSKIYLRDPYPRSQSYPPQLFCSIGKNSGAGKPWGKVVGLCHPGQLPECILSPSDSHWWTIPSLFPISRT